jgi:hypothetical protein
MGLKRAFYDIEKRKETHGRWAKVSNCRWLFVSALANLVLESIELQ